MARFIAGRGNTRMREMVRTYIDHAPVRAPARRVPEAFVRVDGTVVLMVPCQRCGARYYADLLQHLPCCMLCEGPTPVVTQ